MVPGGGAERLAARVLVLNVDIWGADYGGGPRGLRLTAADMRPAQVAADCGGTHGHHCVLFRRVDLISFRRAQDMRLPHMGVGTEYSLSNGTDLEGGQLDLNVGQLPHNRLMLA